MQVAGRGGRESRSAGGGNLTTMMNSSYEAFYFFPFSRYYLGTSVLQAHHPKKGMLVVSPKKTELNF